jgi:hypothetical protein
MVELAALAVLTAIHEWGREPVVATRVVAADAAVLHALVSDPACQWRLHAGLPAALRARAHVAPSRHPRFVHASVRLGERDALWITWILTPRRGTTEVALAAQLDTGSPLARLVLVLGGRRWLRRHLDAVLGTLAALAVRAAEDLDDVERDAGLPVTARARSAI